MTQDEIIEMASQVYGECVWHESTLLRLEAFVKLVAAKATEEANARANASWTLMCEKMVAFEREECAKVCEKLYEEDEWVSIGEASAAIRARGEA